MAAGSELSGTRLDLETCEREPIHTPGSIQPHGLLMVLEEPALRVSRISTNSFEHLGIPYEMALGAELSNLFELSEAHELIQAIGAAHLDEGPVYLCTLRGSTSRKNFHAVGHRHAGELVIELEPARSDATASFEQLYPIVSTLVGRLKKAQTVEAIAQLASSEVRGLTGFDRVLVYKFDNNWNGQVVGESTNEKYSPYLHLWFPASDIPKQARQLYEMNRLRLIADVDYQPVAIAGAPGMDSERPVDLSFAALRSVSPVHLEYLKNMQVASSMSMSLLTGDGRLWGLIACHHRTARFVSLETRTACDLLAQTVATQLEVAEQRVNYERRLWLTSVITRLLAYMAQGNEFLDELRHHPDELLSFGAAGGAAIVHAGTCTCLGACPPQPEIWKLVDWLVEQGREEVFHTDSLPLVLPGANLQEHASGVLAISISKIYRSYVLWLRPEVVQTVNWGGDPGKPMGSEKETPDRLHPRRSFETWKETVRGRSLPWHREEVEAATELRNAIIGIVLRKTEELAGLSEELQRSNKELEAFSYSVSHDLRAPFRHILGYSELLKDSATAKLEENEKRYIEIIIQSANFAGTLVEDLLNFSHLGRTKLRTSRVDTDRLVREVTRDLEQEASGRDIVWNFGYLPAAEADELLLRLVWQNLIENALKYTKNKAQAVIQIEGHEEGQEMVFSITDNGAGFEQAYAGKLFGVFQRLHRMEEFSGTGIGLANVKRIVERHGGRVWATGEVDKGARFSFALPTRSSTA
ncbi:MAG TPA: ATP-binding protein [Bryobacteraceae bacterium]|jgi:light-regulated signal transduction histidine kinase (bacteriophytochrome)|nr:ATP-binding protein [Bryobacteraceae bacterium]